MTHILPGRFHPCATQRNAASASSFSGPKEQQSVSRRHITHCIYLRSFVLQSADEDIPDYKHHDYLLICISNPYVIQIICIKSLFNLYSYVHCIAFGQVIISEGQHT